MTGRGVSPAAIAAWRSRRFRGLRPPRYSGLHELLPLDPLAEPDRARQVAGLLAELEDVVDGFELG